MKNALRIYASIFIVTSGLCAREIRVPRNLERRYFHTPPILHDTERVWEKWDLDIWGAAYFRRACEAYDCCHGTCEVPLAQLFFGKDAFRLNQAFFNSEADIPNQPFLNISVLNPVLEYSEKGAQFGWDAARYVGEHSRVGFRGNLPFKVVKVERFNQSLCSNGDAGGGLSDVCFTRDEISEETIDPGLVQNTAYRMDLLTQITNLDGTPLLDLVYAGKDTLPSIRGTGIGKSGNPIGEENPGLAFIKSNDGSIPTEKFGESFEDLDAAIGPNGELGEGQRGYLDYHPGASFYAPLANDLEAQATLWLVPQRLLMSEKVTGAADTAYNEIAVALDQIVQNGSDCAPQFFEQKGYSFGTQKNVGIGDLYTELYYGHDQCCHKVYHEFSLGFKWPTGDELCDPKKLFLLPRGNDDHVEIRGGYTLIWRPRPWVGIQVYVSGTHAFSHEEVVNPPFVGAGIKNLSASTQTVCADIDWSYFWGHIDFTFYHPHCPGLGFDIGYEPYHKTEDNICLCQKTALDCEGIERPLDGCVLAQKTEVTSHKLRAEFFHHWDCAGIFLGFSHVFAGKNAPVTQEWHLGLNVLF